MDRGDTHYSAQEGDVIASFDAQKIKKGGPLTEMLRLWGFLPPLPPALELDTGDIELDYDSQSDYDTYEEQF